MIRKGLRQVRLAGLVALSGGLLLPSPSATAQEAVRWLMNAKKGENWQYKFVQKLEGKTSNGDETHIITSTTSVRVIAVEKNGDVVLRQTPLSVTFERGTKKETASNLLHSDIGFSRMGLVTKSFDIPSEGMIPYQGAMLLLLNQPSPTAPKRVGETWTTNLPNPLAPAKKVSIVSTLIGKETLLGLKTVKVRLSFSLPNEKDTTKPAILVEGIRNFDLASGKLVKDETTISNVNVPLTQGMMEGKVQITGGLELVKSPAKPTVKKTTKKKK